MIIRAVHFNGTDTVVRLGHSHASGWRGVAVRVARGNVVARYIGRIGQPW